MCSLIFIFLFFNACKLCLETMFLCLNELDLCWEESCIYSFYSSKIILREWKTVKACLRLLVQLRSLLTFEMTFWLPKYSPFGEKSPLTTFYYYPLQVKTTFIPDHIISFDFGRWENFTDSLTQKTSNAYVQLSPLLDLGYPSTVTNSPSPKV